MRKPNALGLVGDEVTSTDDDPSAQIVDKRCRASLSLMQSRRCIAALDADCFYAQCEEIRHPEMAGQPIGVKQKALVITSNYAARAYGIQKGDSLTVVRRKCPNICIYNGEDLTFYRGIAQKVFDVVSSHFSQVEKLGLDELFIDLTEAVDQKLKTDQGPIRMVGFEYGEPSTDQASDTIRRRLAVASKLIDELRTEIRVKVNLTTSAGVSVNKQLAKQVASYRKPGLQTVLVPTVNNLSTLFHTSRPVKRITGIGSATARELAAFNIATVGELLNHSDSTSKLGKSQLAHLQNLCVGLDASVVKRSMLPRSVSAENSFWRSPLHSVGAVHRWLGLLSRRVLLKVRQDEFHSKRRRQPAALAVTASLKDPLNPTVSRRRVSRQAAVPSTVPVGRSSNQYSTALQRIDELDATDVRTSKQLQQKAFELMPTLLANFSDDAFHISILNLSLKFHEEATTTETHNVRKIDELWSKKQASASLVRSRRSTDGSSTANEVDVVDIDESVVAELPPDLQREIRSAQSVSKQGPQKRKSQQGDLMSYFKIEGAQKRGKREN